MHGVVAFPLNSSITASKCFVVAIARIRPSQSHSAVPPCEE